MKPGNQTDLRLYLESEYKIVVTKQIISKLVKEKDYRLRFTPGGKILIEETAKILSDSGFGKRAQLVRQIKGEPEPEQIAINPEVEKKFNGEEELDPDEIPPLNISNQMLTYQRARKAKFEADLLEDKTIMVDDISENSFNLWRQVRDEIQSLKDRCAIKIRASESDHEAEQILHDETHRILSSIVDGYQDLDDDGLKKKLLQRLI
jgi:hypothetical protein